MNEVRYKHRSIVLPPEEVTVCSTLSDDDLKELAHGPQDVSVTYAARHEIGHRIVAKMAQAAADQYHNSHISDQPE